MHRKGNWPVGSVIVGTVGDNTIDWYSDGKTFVGGNALNVAVQVRLCRHRSRYAGAIGQDGFGLRVRQSLRAHGVATDGLVEVENGNTAVTKIRLDESGDRNFESEDFGVCATYWPSSRELDSLAHCDVVHIGMVQAASELRKLLKDRGAIVSQDCAVSTGYEDLDIAFDSVSEGSGDRARQVAEEAIDGGSKLAVITRGAEGSVAFDGSKWTVQEALHIHNVVDTTGAGDSYIAGFLVEWANGRDVRACMAAGSVVAARTCQHWGAWPQEPVIIARKE